MSSISNFIEEYPEVKYAKSIFPYDKNTSAIVINGDTLSYLTDSDIEYLYLLFNDIESTQNKMRTFLGNLIANILYSRNKSFGIDTIKHIIIYYPNHKYSVEFKDGKKDGYEMYFDKYMEINDWKCGYIISEISTLTGFYHEINGYRHGVQTVYNNKLLSYMIDGVQTVYNNKLQYTYMIDGQKVSEYEYNKYCKSIEKIGIDYVPKVLESIINEYLFNYKYASYL